MSDDPYTTKLDKSQEIAYQLWRKRLPPDLQNEHDYDLRGAFLDNAKAAANGHMTDTFKKPWHPTFSEGSKYSTPDMPGGKWADDGQGGYTFWASPTNLQYWHPDDLNAYFSRAEKGGTLILPSMGFDLSKVK